MRFLLLLLISLPTFAAEKVCTMEVSTEYELSFAKTNQKEVANTLKYKNIKIVSNGTPAEFYLHLTAIPNPLSINRAMELRVFNSNQSLKIFERREPSITFFVKSWTLNNLRAIPNCKKLRKLVQE